MEGKKEGTRKKVKTIEEGKVCEVGAFKRKKRI